MTIPFAPVELSLLKELASEFSLANPALAPLLDGSKTDPDVERLIESTLFKNSLISRSLEATFPELIQKLAELMLPHYLRPIPATTIIGFTTSATQGESASIPAGTQFASAPVNGTSCLFATTADLELHPLELIDASFAELPGRAGEIRLTLTLQGLPLSRWRPKSVRLFLSDDHAFASELYLLLSRHVLRIVLAPVSGGASVALPASCLTPTGFAEGEALLPYPAHAFPGYRLLQEYFSTPEKFLFFELSGLERWQERGEGMQFSIIFELDGLPTQPKRIRRESFALHAVPAVNLFSREADPVSVDHGAGLYPIRPAGSRRDHCQIFSVDGVTGYSRATASERTYLPLELFSSDRAQEPNYHTRLVPSQPQGGHGVELCVAFPGGIPPPGTETLSIALTCSNGSLPENLCIGDIAKPLSALPDFVSARNITTINPGQPSPFGPGLFRRLLSHLYLNHRSLATAGQLRTLLELYVLPGQRSGPRGAANLKRISGIEELYLATVEQMVAGLSMRGTEINIKLHQDHFAGPGDLYLFGCLLDHFLGCYASLNSCTRLIVHETSRGGKYQWPTRLGAQPMR